MVKPENLTVLSYANRFTLWHYRSIAQDITEDGYFNQVAELLRVHDLIIATTDMVYKPVTGFYNVSANENGCVEVRALNDMFGGDASALNEQKDLEGLAMASREVPRMGEVPPPPSSH